MLYYINGKFYILSSGYYREVIVEMISKDNLDVRIKQNGDKIEYVHNESRPQISVEEAYKISHKKSLKDEI